MKEELREEDLEKVSGGGPGYADPTYIPVSDRGGHISADHVYIYVGDYVYLVRDNNDRDVLKGKVIQSFSATVSCRSTIVHRVEVTDYDVDNTLATDSRGVGFGVGEIGTFYKNDWTVYLASQQTPKMPKN